MPRAPAGSSRVRALRRVVAEASASLELDRVLAEAVASSELLFGADASAMWLLEPGRDPLRLAAHRGLDPAEVEVAAVDAQDGRAVIQRAIRERRPVVRRHPGSRRSTPGAPPAGAPAGTGFAVVNAVPLIYGDEVLGLIVLYHRARYRWTADEMELSATFAAQVAVAVANARLFHSVRDGAARLRAIQELSLRLNRIQEVQGIGAAIVAEADRLIGHDTIRVYRVDHATRLCEPVAFQGQFTGIGTPTLDDLRVRIGDGLTGWVALHNSTIRLGDAATDPRGRQIGTSRGAESMLLVPMSYESRVLGVIVLSKAGYDQYTDDDQRTLEIFAGYAAQAMVNAEAFGQVKRQQQELRHRLESQRRLLEVNERLLATLDPSGVLEMIADSLKSVVNYDGLTIYRIDRPRSIRRAVVARDRFAELILSHEGPLDVGLTGWAIRHGEAVLANDAHLDPRVEQIPGTPEESESMIVCPLIVGGEVVGTLNVSRMGGDESHFSRDEFELVQLFAGQASIALQNAETHGAVVSAAERDALTGLRNHGAFQRRLDELLERNAPFALLMLDLDAFKAYNDTHGHPAGDTLLRRIAEALTASLRDGDEAFRYGGDEFAILLRDIDRSGARAVADRARLGVAGLTEAAGPQVTASAGIALHPADGHAKDALVATADRALYLAKPGNRRRLLGDDPGRDLYLAAVDETTLRLLERLEPRELLREIVERAAHLVGVEHGFLYLLEEAETSPDGLALVARVGTGNFASYDGYRLPQGKGLGWAVVRSGRPVVVDDYDEYPDRSPDLPTDVFGALCAVPLTAGDEVVGVIGLSSGETTRPFSEREVETVARFAQLASVALDNARLFERAQTEVRRRAHAALHDPMTGLPNRTLLVNRLAEQVEAAEREPRRRRSAARRIALILLDLDRFKLVNESLGHAAGDLLLCEVGRRLVTAARTTDTVARLGSDEFGVLLGPVRSAREAERVASRVEAALAKPFDLDGSEVSISASLGIAVGGAKPAHVYDLLTHAEIALHRAKADPSLGSIMFDPDMHAQTLDRASLEHDLRRALERSELRLHYQPMVRLDTGEVTGLEALVRWEHPTRGLVPPQSFVPLAEETGLILPIGRWVLEQACHQLHDWHGRFTAAGALAVSVNLSARQFGDSGLSSAIASILDHSGLDPAALELEITESVVMDQSEASVERLHGLRALGVRLALDDFGTGYSSLGYLRQLPLDTLKVDRSFVGGLGRDAADLPILQAVVSLAHGLGISVVAEGIESAEQLGHLRRMACDRGQGFLFSRPLPASAVEALLAEAAPGPPRLGAE